MSNKFTFADKPTAGAVAHEDAFGDIFPDGLPWQLEWPSAYQPPDVNSYNCNEYGKILAACAKRGKPVTVREYVDFFWKGTDGVYRWNVTRAIETRSYDDFVRLVSAEVFDV